jgi:uncharacterized protein
MKKIISIVFCGILFTLSSTLVLAKGLSESNFTSQSVSVKSGNILLFGTLVLPQGIENPPVVLLIVGSGPTDRNGNPPNMPNNSLKYLAEDLAKRGIASVRYDKRGVGESVSVQEEKDITIENFIDDAVAWIKFLKSEKKYSSVSIAGHSEGSMIGMVAAQREKVDGFISIAGAGRRIDKVVLEQISSYPEELVNSTKSIFDTLLLGNTHNNVPPILYALFRPSVQPYMISWLKYDPAKQIGLLDFPILIVQGTTDIQVKVIDAELLAGGSKKSKLAIIEKMNHVLKRSELDFTKNFETYSNPNLPIVDEIVNEIESYVKSI